MSSFLSSNTHLAIFGLCAGLISSVLVSACAWYYLRRVRIEWRIVRRFGWRGLVVVVIVVSVIGPPRDYWYMARFPEWGAYGPGVAPVLAIAATYVVISALPCRGIVAALFEAITGRRLPIAPFRCRWYV